MSADFLFGQGARCAAQQRRLAFGECAGHGVEHRQWFARVAKYWERGWRQ